MILVLIMTSTPVSLVVILFEVCPSDESEER